MQKKFSLVESKKELNVIDGRLHIYIQENRYQFIKGIYIYSYKLTNKSKL